MALAYSVTIQLALLVRGTSRQRGARYDAEFDETSQFARMIDARSRASDLHQSGLKLTDSNARVAKRGLLYRNEFFNAELHAESQFRIRGTKQRWPTRDEPVVVALTRVAPSKSMAVSSSHCGYPKMPGPGQTGHKSGVWKGSRSLHIPEYESGSGQEISTGALPWNSGQVGNDLAERRRSKVHLIGGSGIDRIS
ncbi:hypothetical protein B0H11DRAFT_1908437 [Mycena galericulata]|nr:hypothetical protein B0H11DRAFT_1908437 [Mycena galericulata]